MKHKSVQALRDQILALTTEWSEPELPLAPKVKVARQDRRSERWHELCHARAMPDRKAWLNECRVEPGDQSDSLLPRALWTTGCSVRRAAASVNRPEDRKT